MAADKLTPALIKDVTPNLNMMMKLITATSDDTADYVEMDDYDFTTVYAAWAVDVTDNSAVVCAISDSTKITLTGTAGETTILVIGV